MSASHCDRCGCTLPEGAASARPRLCPPCRVAVAGARRGRGLGVLGILLAGTLSAWVGWRLTALEARLDRAEARTSKLEARSLRPADPDPLPAPPLPPPPVPEPAPEPEPEPEAPAEPGSLLPARDLRPTAPVEPAPVPRPHPEVPAAAPAPADLVSRDPVARYRALEALADPAHAAAARRLLKDPAGFVRRGAAAALGRLGASNAAQDLLAMARSEEDVSARLAAMKALEAVTGVARRAGDDPASLRDWEAWIRNQGGAP